MHQLIYTLTILSIVGRGKYTKFKIIVGTYGLPLGM